MTEQFTNIEKLLLELTKDLNCYYLKQPSIYKKGKNGYYIYSHFQLIPKKIDLFLIRKHLQKELTLAIPLKKITALVFEYRGKEAYAFGTLLFRILKEYHLKGQIIEYSLDKLLIFVSFLNNKELIEKKEYLIQDIKKIMPQDWRILPIDSKPDLGNLLILPREIVDNPW